MGPDKIEYFCKSRYPNIGVFWGTLGYIGVHWVILGNMIYDIYDIFFMFYKSFVVCYDIL